MTLGPAFRSWNDYPILGPYAIASTALTTISSSVVPADGARAGIYFHNPGSKNKRVMPDGLPLVGGSGGILIYPQSDFILLKTLDARYNVNCAWNAVTDDDTDGSLTILNFTPLTPGAPMVRPGVRLLQQIPVVSPVALQTNSLGAGSQALLPADPNRHGVLFSNPGTVTCAVCPDNLAASIGAGSIIVLPGAEKRIVGNDLVKINCGWNAIAQSGSGNSLTALGLYG